MRDYTLTFKSEYLYAFNDILSRLDDEGSGYAIVQPATPGKSKYGEDVHTAVLSMEEETAFMFRMGVRKLDMKMIRTAEEQAELDRIKEEKTVRIRVNVDNGEVHQ